MENEYIRTTTFALYPSTLKRMREYKAKGNLSWDELFNTMLTSMEKKEKKS